MGIRGTPIILHHPLDMRIEVATTGTGTLNLGRGDLMVALIGLIWTGGILVRDMIGRDSRVIQEAEGIPDLKVFTRFQQNIHELY